VGTSARYGAQEAARVHLEHLLVVLLRLRLCLRLILLLRLLVLLVLLVLRPRPLAVLRLVRLVRAHLRVGDCVLVGVRVRLRLRLRLRLRVIGL